MNDKIITNRSSTVIVQVDRADSDFAGQVYSSFYGAGTDFRGVYGFLNVCEDLFDAMACPQSAVAERSFREKCAVANIKPAGVVEDMEKILKNNDKNTFVVNVLFRQNASWQGNIQWVNQNKTRSFRSTLELIKLMDSALAGEEETVIVDWKSAE